MRGHSGSRWPGTDEARAGAGAPPNGLRSLHSLALRTSLAPAVPWARDFFLPGVAAPNPRVLSQRLAATEGVAIAGA